MSGNQQPYESEANSEALDSLEEAFNEDEWEDWEGEEDFDYDFDDEDEDAEAAAERSYEGPYGRSDENDKQGAMQPEHCSQEEIDYYNSLPRTEEAAPNWETEPPF